jgi:hypothetical protein
MLRRFKTDPRTGGILTDYKLDGLSPRSFEHLIQSLSLQVLGPMVTPFGDGPDGGREATFDGTTLYGPPDDPWNGYGAIQAKFLQRSTGSTADGRWAIKQLSAELARYGKRRPTRRPDYYIFATNVVLTPTENAGSKDRIIKMLETFTRKHRLKGFDVWDYDKLRLMIDNNEPVRRAYAAWVTPGDVLAELASWLSEKRHDFYKLLTNFLQKELLSDQYAKLEQAGHSADESIPLAQVFVDLPTADRSYSEPPKNLRRPNGKPAFPGFVESVLQTSALRLTPDAESGSSSKTGGPTLSRHDLGRYVLIGGPGQGKTTIGQFVCQLFRTALLQDVKSSALEAQVRQTLEAIKSQCSEGLMDSNDEVTQARLREIAGNYNWRNVFLFAAGKCFAQRRYLRDTIEAICTDLNDDPNDGVSRATLAGSELALELLQDGPASRQPAKNRALTRLALRLLRIPSRPLHNRLADIYQPTTTDIFTEELADALRNRSNLGSGVWACLAQLIEVAPESFSALAKEHLTKAELSDPPVFGAIASNTHGRTWLADDLLRAVPLQAPSELQRMIIFERAFDFDTGELGPWPAEPLPAWFNALPVVLGRRSFAQQARLSVRFQLGSERSEVGQLMVPGLGVLDIAELEAVKKVPAGHPEWAVLKAQADFSANPTRTTLSEALRETMNAPRGVWAYPTYRSVPWPLVECLERAESASDLGALASAAARGQLGDIADWAAAERRWSEGLVSVADLEAWESGDFPFGSDVSEIGFPFSCSSLRTTTEHALYALADAFLASTTPRHELLAALLADGLLGGTFHTPPERFLRSSKALVEELALTLLPTERWYLTMELLGLLELPLAGINERWLQVLDSLAYHLPIDSFPSSLAHAVYGLSREAWIVRPGADGLISLLGALAQHAPEFEAPPGIDDIVFENLPSLAQAALLAIHARSGTYADSMVSQFETVLHSEPRTLEMVVNALAASDIPDDQEGALLLRLDQSAQRVSQKRSEIMVSALRDVLRRRRSRLCDPRVWRQLAFPEELSELVAQDGV